MHLANTSTSKSASDNLKPSCTTTTPDFYERSVLLTNVLFFMAKAFTGKAKAVKFGLKAEA